MCEIPMIVMTTTADTSTEKKSNRQLKSEHIENESDDPPREWTKEKRNDVTPLKTKTEYIRLYLLTYIRRAYIK